MACNDKDECSENYRFWAGEGRTIPVRVTEDGEFRALDDVTSATAKFPGGVEKEGDIPNVMDNLINFVLTSDDTEDITNGPIKVTLVLESGDSPRIFVTANRMERLG